MDWVVNQIWLGSSPLPEQAKKTEEKAYTLGLGYKLWTWDDLTARFGVFYFGNFIIDQVPLQGLTYLTKFYAWMVLESYKGKGMFLDATRSLPFETLNPEIDFKQLGVYTTKEYEAWFIACNDANAALMAKKRIILDLDSRYKANREYLFYFFRSERASNVSGTRFLQNVLIPMWEYKGIQVFNDPNPENTTPLFGEVDPIFLPSVSAPSHVHTVNTIQELQRKTQHLKLKPIFATIPKNCSRVIIVGDQIMGITDIDTVATDGDLLVHLNSCPFLTITEKLTNVCHSIFYSSASLLPSYIAPRRHKYWDVQQVIPHISFNGYTWKENVTSEVSLPVALALSYKELNPSATVVIHGHNTADDVIGNYDSVLEDVLLSDHGILSTSPKYEMLLLVLSRESHKLQRVLISRAWDHILSYTKHTYRFCFSSEDKKYPSIMEKTWPLPNAGDDKNDEEVGQKFFAGLKNAARMRFQYLFILPDDTLAHPLNLWAWLLGNTPETFGKRVYDEEKALFYYDFACGIGLSYNAVQTILEVIPEEVVKKNKDIRPDFLIAQAIKEQRLAMSDFSELCRKEGETEIPTFANKLISCPHGSESEWKYLMEAN